MDIAIYVSIIQVISYGNYDYDSIRLFETIGDGVLFIATRKLYSILHRTDHKTIFSYGVRLTVKQLASVKREIEKLKENTYLGIRVHIKIGMIVMTMPAVFIYERELAF